MKQVEITAKGGPGVLKIREVPAPALTPDGVRIAVKAAGINFADLQMRMGMYPEAPPIPFVPAALPVPPVGSRSMSGARFMVNPRARMPRPCAATALRYWAVVSVFDARRALGSTPTAIRRCCTRPPSSSTVTSVGP